MKRLKEKKKKRFHPVPNQGKCHCSEKSIEIHKDGRDEVTTGRYIALETELPEEVPSNQRQNTDQNQYLLQE